VSHGLTHPDMLDSDIWTTASLAMEIEVGDDGAGGGGGGGGMDMF